nr:craniofacial development protein 2-like [Danaus plexippus plexippus]
MSGAEGNGRLLHYHPMRVIVINGNNEAILSCYPADARRPQSAYGITWTETHWTDSGYSTTDRGNKIYFTGPEDEDSKWGAFIAPITVDKYVSGYRPINDRLIVLRLNTVPCRMNIIQVYAPTAQSTVEEIENFYYALTSALKDIPKREITIVLGDFNAKTKLVTSLLTKTTFWINGNDIANTFMTPESPSKMPRKEQRLHNWNQICYCQKCNIL